MSFELSLLLWSAALALLHVSVHSMLYKAQVGNNITMGARDEMPAATKFAGRAERALRNFLETYMVFVALVVVVEFSCLSDPYTQWGAGIYMGMRVLYLPLYLSGRPWVRTICWNFATGGLALMIMGVVV